MINQQKFKFNPFSGVLEEDLGEVIIPRFNLDEIVTKIEAEKPLTIEFLGKQGRGKTTHLTYLQQHLNKYPIYYLNGKFNVAEIINEPSKVVFIDSIHHLSFIDRISLFKAKDKVIYTSHWNRKIESFFAKKELYSLKFNGINTLLLKEVLNKRLHFAAYSKQDLQKNEMFSNKDVTELIKKFGDNYRGIINSLFEKYQWEKQ